MRSEQVTEERDNQVDYIALILFILGFTILLQATAWFVAYRHFSEQVAPEDIELLRVQLTRPAPAHTRNRGETSADNQSSV